VHAKLLGYNSSNNILMQFVKPTTLRKYVQTHGTGKASFFDKMKMKKSNVEVLERKKSTQFLMEKFPYKPSNIHMRLSTSNGNNDGVIEIAEWGGCD